MTSDIDFLITLRDACTMIADAATAALDARNPHTWNPDRIAWQPAHGTRGPYQRYPANGDKIQVTPDYKALLADLKEHKGKLARNGCFYWVFKDAATIGRKAQGARR